MSFSVIRRLFLGSHFQPGAFASVQQPTQHQLGVQARVVEYLKRYGGIDALTAQGLGTTDARKLFTRLRKKGYLHPADDTRGHVVLPNASGQGTYRWHRWTGKQ